jgi:hypothetical protein
MRVLHVAGKRHGAAFARAARYIVICRDISDRAALRIRHCYQLLLNDSHQLERCYARDGANQG